MSTFYTDHWRDIEGERLDRYERMFQFRPEQEQLLAPLDLTKATRVLDFGCGPGFMAEEIASRVDGEVIGVDLNADFIARAIERNQRSNLNFFHLGNSTLIDQIGEVDRIFCKNVLEYVPDLEATLASFYEVLLPDGQALIIDSDWGFVLVEPWGKARTDNFFEAASQAFNEPLIGRKLPGAMASVGFTDVQVKMIAGVDLKGWGMNVLTNMVSYIRQFETKPESELIDMMSELETGINNGSYMFVLPQFLIAARKS